MTCIHLHRRDRFSTSSSQYGEAISTVQVNASHQDIHHRPKTILEIRRILLEHAKDVQYEFAKHKNSQRAQQVNFEEKVRIRPLTLPAPQEEIPVPHDR